MSILYVILLLVLMSSPTDIKCAKEGGQWAVSWTPYWKYLIDWWKGKPAPAVSPPQEVNHGL